MAQAEAGIRVRLKGEDFRNGLDAIERQVKAAGGRMGGSLGASLSSSLKAGTQKARETIAGDFKAIGGHIKTVATLGGAVSFGAMVASASHLQELYSLISSDMERVSGQSFSIARAQEVVSAAAAKTKRTHEEMAVAFKTMIDRGADPTFAVRAMETIGHTMNVTGMDAERTGRLLAGLSVKYGLSGESASTMISAVLETASAAKVQTEEFMEDFNEFGSIAKMAGQRGEEGLNLILNVVRQMGPQLNGTTSEINSGMDIFFERV